MSTVISITLFTGRVKLNKTSVSENPLILHHLFELDGGGVALICAGRTPIDVSEMTVEGAFSPSHSIEIAVGADPRATGEAHTSTDFSLIAETCLTVVTADVAVKRRLRTFFLVIP
jgi:hypothetical protein